MKSILVCCFFSLFIFASCSKKPHRQEIILNEGLRSKFNYKVGSYWIYRDSISGMVDSIFVTANTYDQTPGAVAIDGIDIELQQVNISGASNARKSNWEYQYVDDEISIFYTDGKSYEIDYSPFINYPLQENVHESAYAMQGNPSTNVKSIGTFALNGSSYPNTFRIYSNVYSQLVQFDDQFYFNEDAGIIKMRLSHPLDTLYRVWELQRKNLIK